MKPSRIGIIFDDGFLKSTLATAELFDEFRIPAVFAVLAEPKGFAPHIPIGDFALWNELQARGHIVQPHGFTHAKLSDLPHERAVEEVERCLAAFGEKLDGFDAKRAIYCCAYNCSTDRLNPWLLSRVHAVRVGGDGLLSQKQFDSRIWHSDAFGPDDPGDKLLALLDRVRKNRPPYLLHCLHGIDGEGWGAIALDKLRRVLEIITADDTFEYWPVGKYIEHSTSNIER